MYLRDKLVSNNQLHEHDTRCKKQCCVPTRGYESASALFHVKQTVLIQACEISISLHRYLVVPINHVL